MKLVLGCVSKFSVGRIQNGHIYLIYLQVYGRLWQGFRLGVQTCSDQLIALLDIKYPSISSFNPSFVDFWRMCISFTGSVFIDTETYPQMY